ncbi:MAG: aldehyde dehydrogenase family protein [Planctomycetota bacterium]
MATMFIGGERIRGSRSTEVTSPFDGTVIDTVPVAAPSEIDRALAVAEGGAKRLRKSTGHERSQWLKKASELLAARAQQFAELISREEGKPLAESTFEVSRAVQTLELSAEEARRIVGEMIPLDGAAGNGDKIGFTLRVPCGVVAAITPFNFPLNLVAHKLGPAIAAGNSVLLKPASDTPLSGLKLVELLLEANVPPDAIQGVTGPGGELSQALCGDRRVRKISFTGSFDVGERICKVAGMKRVTMELGSNAPLIVMDDANLDKVIRATVATGYSNAGQVCISTQRVLVDSKVYGDFLDGLKPKVEALTLGDPLKPETTLGPMIREADAARVTSWIREAVEQGARLVTGKEREGTKVPPAIVADVHPNMRIVREELFGPAVTVQAFSDLEAAIALANDSRYGLAAGIFTENLGRAMKFIREVDSGNLHVNWGPAWRADLMPYGGLKDSGMGKEGPAFAIQEMTEQKMVVLHL